MKRIRRILRDLFEEWQLLVAIDKDELAIDTAGHVVDRSDPMQRNWKLCELCLNDISSNYHNGE